MSEQDRRGGMETLFGIRIGGYKKWVGGGWNDGVGWLVGVCVWGGWGERSLESKRGGGAGGIGRVVLGKGGGLRTRWSVFLQHPREPPGRPTLISKIARFQREVFFIYF